MKTLKFVMTVMVTLSLAACQTFSWVLPSAELVARDGDRITIRYTYGSVSEDSLRTFRDSYDKKLQEKADELCEPNRTVEVLERSRTPSTLSNLKNIDKNDFFWVFRYK